MAAAAAAAANARLESCGVAGGPGLGGGQGDPSQMTLGPPPPGVTQGPGSEIDDVDSVRTKQQRYVIELAIPQLDS